MKTYQIALIITGAAVIGVAGAFVVFYHPNKAIQQQEQVPIEDQQVSNELNGTNYTQESGDQAVDDAVKNIDTVLQKDNPDQDYKDINPDQDFGIQGNNDK